MTKDEKIAKLREQIRFYQNLYNRTGTGYAFLRDLKNDLRELERLIFDE